MKSKRFNPDEVAGKTPIEQLNPRQQNISNILEILANGEKVSQDKFHDISGTGIDEMFKGLNGNLPEGLTDNFLNALSGALGGYSDIATPERTDMLMQYLLQMLTTSDQRSYDKQVLNEQRIYDTPQNQLARLMGAGISRDAAIQLLQGGQNPALVGSGLGASAPAVSAPSGTMGNQIANSVISCLDTVGSLVSAGFSIPMALNQYRLASNSAYMSNEQKNAYQSASSAFTLLNSAGVPLDDSHFGSISAVSQSLTDLAKSNDAAKAFIDAGGLKMLRQTSPYSSPFLNQLYRNERASRDYNTSFGAQVNLMRAQEQLAKANQDKLREEIKLIAPQIENLRSQTFYQNAMLALTDFQAIYLKAQTRQANAQAKSMELQNTLEDSFQSTSIDGKSGVDMYTEYRIQQLWQGVSNLTYLNDNEAWKKEANAFLAQQDNLKSMYELATLYQNGEIDMLKDLGEDDKSLLYFCRAAEACHLFDYVRTIAESETAGKWNFNGAGGSKSAATEELDILRQHGKKKSNWQKFWDWKPFAH